MTSIHPAGDLVGHFAKAIYDRIGAKVDPIPDGKLHRFDDPEGKHSNRACWYVLHIDGVPAGVYGNWRTGEKDYWRAAVSRDPSPKEAARFSRAVRAAINEREAKIAERRFKAKARAQATWEGAAHATAKHPYLARKGICALGLRQAGGALLVPLQTINGELVNLQVIHQDGAKRFLKGGQVTGAFCLTGADEIPKDGTLYIAEGLATAATIAKALRGPVVASMNAGNLKPVAEAIHAEFPRLALVIAADNDWRTEGNPGITKAREAAAAVEGFITWPAVCMEEGCICTDFNDLEHCGRADQ